MNNKEFFSKQKLKYKKTKPKDPKIISLELGLKIFVLS